MMRTWRKGLILAGLAMVCSLAWPQTTPGPAGPALGKGHLWLKAGQFDLNGDAAGEWGVDREGYLALEGYGELDDEVYIGGELGRSAAASGVNDDGDRIEDFDFLWLEWNTKMAFDLERGFSVDVGLGGALFYVSGDKVIASGDFSSTAPLADVGFGVQVFTDFNWRTRRLLIGLDAKYQWAFDVIDISYSNLRFGAHVGFCF